MSIREAVIQACMELGMSRETVELRAKFMDRFLPDAAARRESQVEPGCERQFIAALKVMLRRMEDPYESIEAAVDPVMEKRAKLN